MRYLKYLAPVIILIAVACGGGAKEIPTEKMAKIFLKMMMEDKIEKDHSDPKEMKDEVITPYAEAEGFTAADFKYTATLYDKDEKKGKEFGEVFGKMLMDEMMKTMGGNDKMMNLMNDSTHQNMMK
jgi:hypothetical protein